MRTWLEQPVTRGEVLGWTLAVPAVLSIGGLGPAVVDLIGDSRHVASLDPGRVPTFLAVCLRLGEGGMAAVFVFCAFLALGAQFSRQRAWMRVLAPVVAMLLAHAAGVRLMASRLEHATYLDATLQGQAAAASAGGTPDGAEDLPEER